MRRADFHYELPEELIAQHPSTERGDGRLLVLAGGRRVDRRFADLPECLRSGDLLVFNDTRVVRARLFARKDTGGRVELLLERVVEEAGRNEAAAGNQDGQQRLDAAAPDAQRTGDSRAGVVEEQQSRIALFHARASKPLRAGAVLHLQGGGRATVRARHEDLFELQLEAPVLDYLAHHGQVPLPPYIKRTDAADALDAERYQTVFARADGAVAAPTAGLHFDAALLERLAAAGVERAYVTLHVGAGTFQPVRVEDLSRHHMHRERFEVSAAVCEAVAAARARGGRVIAVGTTVVRSLESAWRGALTPTRAETDLFIRPGYQFRVVDALLTNFHLPESTLLMLVCAFGGTETVLAAYRHAVARQYRFFSYGDAMLVIPDEVATAARAAHPSTQEVR